MSMSRACRGIWIPIDIWTYEGLSRMEAILWAEIDSLDIDKNGGCYASNSYLCSFMGVEERQLQRYLKNLQDKNLISIELINGKQRRIRSLKFHIKKQNNPVKNDGNGVMDDGGAVINDTPPHIILENKAKNKEQQQQSKKDGDKLTPTLKGAVAPAVVFSCLQDVKIPQADKEWITANHAEPDVSQAVAYALHPETKIKTSLAQVIKWACKAKPELPADVVALSKENKPYAESIERKVPNNSNARISALNEKVEVYYASSGHVLPDVIDYGNPNFKPLFHKALEKFGLGKLIQKECLNV